MELERLIETEQHNDELLRHARDEATALVNAARDAASHREAALAAEVETTTRANEEALAAERDRRLADIRTATRDQVARYNMADDQRVHEVAQAMVELLITGGDAA